jgi:hypothetical protein
VNEKVTALGALQLIANGWHICVAESRPLNSVVDEESAVGHELAQRQPLVQLFAGLERLREHGPVAPVADRDHRLFRVIRRKRQRVARALAINPPMPWACQPESAARNARLAQAAPASNESDTNASA